MDVFDERRTPSFDGDEDVVHRGGFPDLWECLMDIAKEAVLLWGQVVVSCRSGTSGPVPGRSSTESDMQMVLMVGRRVEPDTLTPAARCDDPMPEDRFLKVQFVGMVDRPLHRGDTTRGFGRVMPVGREVDRLSRNMERRATRLGTRVRVVATGVAEVEPAAQEGGETKSARLADPGGDSAGLLDSRTHGRVPQWYTAAHPPGGTCPRPFANAAVAENAAEDDSVATQNVDP